MLGKDYHVKKEECLLGHFKIPLLAGQDWKVPVKAAARCQLPCSELLSIPSPTKTLTSFRAEVTQARSHCSEQISQRLGAPRVTAGPEAASPMQGGGFLTIPSPTSGTPTSAWQSCIRKPSAAEATRTLPWRTVWKREFLICGKFQHSEICFSSTCKGQAKIPWSVWNGSPGEEQGEGMEKIKKLYSEGKKIKTCWYCFDELCHFLTSTGTKPGPWEDSQSLQLTGNLGEMHEKQTNN